MRTIKIRSASFEATTQFENGTNLAEVVAKTILSKQPSNLALVIEVKERGRVTRYFSTERILRDVGAWDDSKSKGASK